MSKLRSVLVYALFAAALVSSPAVAGETISVPATATTAEMPAYVARPATTTPAPGVLVLHGCEGYRPIYGDVADGLAQHGYVAVAIDTLKPQGRKSGCEDPGAARAEARYARAALDWMRAQPYIDGGRLALLGYSQGATAVLDVVDSRLVPAAPPGVLAAITYYPACRNRDPASVRVPIRILDGDADDWTPSAPCQTLADGAPAAGTVVSITTYPGASHAFNFPGSDRVVLGHHLRYDASAAADAATQTLDFLGRYLAPAP